MDVQLPALALAAVPKRRRATLDLAREIERRGFAGIHCAQAHTLTILNDFYWPKKTRGT